MNILFLHPNFPAQFKTPCIRLAKNKKHDIKFICQTHYGRGIDGIEKLTLKGSGSHQSIINNSKNESERQLSRAKAYRGGFELLKRGQWKPDVVIGHSGWGCGIYVKEIWPDTTFISYLEWWFNPESELVNCLKNNENFELTDESITKLWIRNMPSALEMATANLIITPSEWQKEQLPQLLKDNCRVIPDEIDKNIFFPNHNKLSSHPVVTYGTRGMEPMRGFPEFIKILPQLLKKWPQLVVEIAGSDTVSYGGKLPKEKTWKAWALKIFESEHLTERIIWKGTMPLKDYADWLKSSWCHVYLSEPFVTSWSFIEALHCHCPMVASATKATQEFCEISPNIITVDHKNLSKLFESINDRIRFSSNFSQSAPPIRHEDASKNSYLSETSETSETSLATIIADVEATTMI